jgi:hypothetical protein
MGRTTILKDCFASLARTVARRRERIAGEGLPPQHQEEADGSGQDRRHPRRSIAAEATTSQPVSLTPAMAPRFWGVATGLTSDIR